MAPLEQILTMHDCLSTCLKSSHLIHSVMHEMAVDSVWYQTSYETFFFSLSSLSCSRSWRSR